ncbi:thermopsin [Vulcanisaeta sp. JCM 16161]|uniref:thermopsin family protease n=1 Tax=Vulcanisaeta sp. JCM 16161 TaxID=1295372 RepID=UPI001FB296AF|nr:thermopsin family protease [Vulcanisaeta sp. JCM 16161]
MGWWAGGAGNYTWFSSVPGIYVVSPSPGNYDLLVCGNTGIIYRVLNYTAMGLAAYYGPGYGNITTNAVLGFFNITNAYIENSTGAAAPGFSLQLNAYVLIRYGGNYMVHWFRMPSSWLVTSTGSRVRWMSLITLVPLETSFMSRVGAYLAASKRQWPAC